MKTTDFLTALHLTMKVIDPPCYTSGQMGVVYGIGSDISSILKVAGKRVPGDVYSA